MIALVPILYRGWYVHLNVSAFGPTLMSWLCMRAILARTSR